jgi:hypothetical protein
MQSAAPLTTPLQQTPDAREDSGYESKYLLTPAAAEEVAAWAGALPGLDFATDSAAPPLHVSSLYFDSPELEIFRRAETPAVDKYRIRRYNEEPVLYLECKSKRAGSVSKRRTAVPAGELGRVHPPSGPMDTERAADARDWPGAWFAEALTRHGLRPVCHVAYVRAAWVGEMNGQRARLTLDRDLRCAPAAGLDLPGCGGDARTLLDGCILEVKHAAPLAEAFHHRLIALGCEPRAFSKYRRAMHVCGMGAR